MTDAQQNRVYHAEGLVIQLFGYDKVKLTLKECLDFVALVTTSPYWVRKYHSYDSYSIVYDGKEVAWSNYDDENNAEISLPAWARNKLTILHELTHLAIHRETLHGAHSKMFATINLKLIKKFLGKEEYSKVKLAYDYFGVKYG